MKSNPRLLQVFRSPRIQINRFRTPAFAWAMAFSMAAPDLLAFSGALQNNLNPEPAPLEGVLFSGEVNGSNQPLEGLRASLNLPAKAPAAPLAEHTIYAEGVATVGVSKNDPTNNPSDDVFILNVRINRAQRS